MKVFKCPICENQVEISEHAKKGERVTCTHCFAQLALHHYKGKEVLACANCKETVFDPANCGACERRRELKKIWEEGKL